LGYYGLPKADYVIPNQARAFQDKRGFSGPLCWVFTSQISIVRGHNEFEHDIDIDEAGGHNATMHSPLDVPTSWIFRIRDKIKTFLVGTRNSTIQSDRLHRL
jgi:hypothetical protein